ncbi:MAG: hypothetical protein MRK02_15240 [Candidatus Scalindua sp.]|nr:hypothetical protein [Candidatus Scalindua sp.]
MCITLYSYDPTISAEKQVKTVLIGYETGVSPSGKNVVYEGRNVGEAFVTGRGFRIRVDLWERESGDPEDFRRNIEDNVKTGVRVGLSVLANAIGAGEAGEALAQAFSGIAGKGATALLEEIFGDDFIGSRDFNVSGQFLEQIKDDIDGSLIRHTPGLPERIVFNFPRDSQEMYWLISGGGGSYKVYFTITAIRADQPITP